MQQPPDRSGDLGAQRSVVHHALLQSMHSDALPYPNPLTPSTSSYPVVGFWYLPANANCVQNSQITPPTPGQSTCAAYFEYYLADFGSINFSSIPFPCCSNPNLGSFQLEYNNYYYRCYTLGNSAVDWNQQAQYITPQFVQQMLAAGYNAVILDVESAITPQNFNNVVDTFLQNGCQTIMLYSTQYNYFSQPLSAYQFNNITYGMPSIYGYCNTATLCDNLATWTDSFGIPINRLVTAIVKGTWGQVSSYPYKTSSGPTTTLGAVVAGYIEWNYNLDTNPCTNYITCNKPDPC